MNTAQICNLPLTSDITARELPSFIAFQPDVATSRLQHILNILPAGIILLDSKGFVAEANPVAVQMLGHPLLKQRWLDVIARCFRPRNDDGMEVSLKDGRRVKLAITALSPEPGQLIILTDLTETRQLQSRLAHTQRLSALGKMMASLAHQIRTPLSSAMLYAENLANPRLTLQTQQQFQQKLVSRLQDLEQQVNDMLLFARSGMVQDVIPVSVKDLIGSLQKAAEALLQQHQAQLLVTGSQQDTLLAHSGSLVGALLNLMHNSLQAIPQQAMLSLNIAKAEDRPGFLRLILQDNGPGIAAEVQPKIFEPFFTTRSQGTGLGLAVVKAVVTSHQGTVHYIDKIDGGACFELLLPLFITTEQRS